MIGLPPEGTSRRQLLRLGLGGCMVAGGGLLAGGCAPSRAPTPSPTGLAPSPRAAGDAGMARLAAGLELALKGAYDGALSLSNGGSLGAVPAALLALQGAARSHHLDHLRAWTGLLVGGAGVEADARLAARVSDGLGRATSLSDLMAVLRDAEEVAAETYATGAASQDMGQWLALALTIAPVEAQHVAVLNLMMGRVPVPDPEIGSRAALGPDQGRG